MPICIECSYPVSHLYSTYSRADDRSLGKGVRLTQCPRCQRFADKYVEYDFVVLFIDLVLIKPQVYRHLLFNRLGRDDNQFDRSIIRLGVLLLLFDVYLTWARIEKYAVSTATSFLSRTPIIIQYLFFLSSNALATLAHHLTVRLLASVLVPRRRSSAGGNANNGSVARKSDNETAGAVTEQQQQQQPSIPAASAFASQPDVSHSAAMSSSTSPPRSLRQVNPMASTSSSSLPATTIAAATATNGSHSGSHFPHLPPPPPPPHPSLRRSSTAPALNVQPLPPPSPASPSAISTALLVSSCAKLFPILLVIWGPDGGGGGGSSSNTSSSDSYSTSRTGAGAGATAGTHGQGILIAPHHGTATPVATLIANSAPTSPRTLFLSTPSSSASFLLSSSSSSSSPSDTWSLTTTLETYLSALISALISALPESISTPLNNHLASILELAGSLLSLGAADTHLVLLSNVEALYILLGCGYLRAIALAVAGLLARWAVQKVVLGLVGVG